MHSTNNLFENFQDRTISKKIKKIPYKILNNKKYVAAEVLAYFSGISFAYATMYLLEDQNLNLDLKLLTSGVGKTVGWFSGNIGTFKFVELFQKPENKINYFILTKNNTFSCLGSLIIKYGLSKILVESGIEPKLAVSITAATSGFIPTIIRHIYNAKKDILRLEDRIEKEKN